MDQKNDPKDLGLEIGTRDEVVWTEVVRQCKITIEGCEKELLIQKEILRMAEGKVAKEKEKFK